jgi:tetratricopeptide (TPR) repeat protein
MSHNTEGETQPVDAQDQVVEPNTTTSEDTTKTSEPDTNNVSGSFDDVTEELTTTKQENVTDLTDDGGRRFETPEDYMEYVAQLRQQGNKTFHKKEYEGAITEYHECLRIMDAVVKHIKLKGIDNFAKELISDIINQRVLTYTNIALCYLKIEDISRAFSNVNKAIDNDETNTKALYLRAKIYLEGKYLQEAKEDIDVILEQNPTNKEAVALNEAIDAAIVKARENDKLQTHRHMQRVGMGGMGGMGGMMGGMTFFDMMNMNSFRNIKSREEEEMERAIELSRLEFQREEEKRKKDEEEKKKADDEQEEMRKYFESLKVQQPQEAPKEEEEVEEDDDDEFVLDDDDEDEDGDEDGDEDDDDDDEEPVDNDEDEDN